MNADELKALNPFEIADRITSGEFSVVEDKHSRSRVWTVFGKIINQNGIEVPNYAYCRTCGKIFTYRVSTSNLGKHKCLLKFFSKCKDNENDTSTNENVKVIIETDEIPVDKITTLLTQFIIKGCRPYDFMQNRGLLDIFQEFARIGSKFGDDIDVKKLLPSVPVIAQNVSGIYEQCFQKVKSEIDSIKENGFGLTNAIWSDNFSRQSYIALTIHYLKNGQLKYRFLGLQTIDGVRVKSSCQNVAEKVKQILKDFDCELSTKSIIVTDNDNYNKDSDTKRLPCMSQLLDRTLLKSVEEIDEANEVISSSLRLVSYLKKNGNDSFFGDSLQKVYPTRWILIHKLLYSIESNWNKIVKTLQSANEKEIVSKINIRHLKAMIKTLQPFEEAIETLEDDSTATLHLVLVYMHELKKSCATNYSEFNDFAFIESLKQNLRLKIGQIVTENITIIHKLALFLYPPTNKLLQFSDEEKKSVDEECIRIMKCFKNESKPIIKDDPDDVLDTPVLKRKKLFSDFVETEANRDPNELIIQEIQYYKNTRVVNSCDFDIFGWWELQKQNFPLLYKLSCVVLATPATSSASKRIFPAASSLLYEKSNRWSSDAEAEKIMFINANSEHDEVENYFVVKNMS